MTSMKNKNPSARNHQQEAFKRLFWIKLKKTDKNNKGSKNYSNKIKRDSTKMFWRGLRSFCNISCRSFNFVKAEKIYDTNLNYSNPCFFAISMSMFSKLFFDASETAKADEKHTCCVWRSCILIHAFFKITLRCMCKK